MAQLTPEDILKIAEPIEKVYQNTVDSLLINIAKHFNSGKALSTQQWELQKLAELGQLNRESIDIIARMTGQTPELVKAALENAAQKALKDIEPALKNAVEQGFLTASAASDALASESIVNALTYYAQQATEKLNLVNTTMLESTLNQYRKIVANTVNIENQMIAAQEILNNATGKVVLGTESRTEALRKALEQIHKEGITGFYDRAGRKWSPEAYVNMDIRTTVHNTAIEAVKNRQQDYNSQVFQVSEHVGARPLCYPYQGKYYSWDNSAGTFTDGVGGKHKYSPLSSTSYGQAAGLFGINCKHYPIAMIPGFSIPRHTVEQTKAENDKAYQESQQQRALEREIRYAKTRAAMFKAAGDTEGVIKANAQIKQAQADMRNFISQTGRTRRPDREQVYKP